VPLDVQFDEHRCVRVKVQRMKHFIAPPERNVVCRADTPLWPAGQTRRQLPERRGTRVPSGGHHERRRVVVIAACCGGDAP
jgi:hypothetical protein